MRLKNVLIVVNDMDRAINVANESIGTESLAELADKNQLIYVYCRSGNRSKQAAEKLVALGYTNIIEFGGIREYYLAKCVRLREENED